MIKLLKVLMPFVAFAMLYSCSAGTLVTSKVAYQSVRNVDYKKDVPEDAKIVVYYSISEIGDLNVVVENKTSEIMVVDQTMSFFVNSDNQSISYYDPTVRVSSETDMVSATKDASVNLGSIGGALGIGGRLGTALNGINVGGSGTVGTSVTNTTYFADQPKISLAPKSTGAMSKVFRIKGIGKTYLATQSSNWISSSEKESITRFSVCISYSVDGGKTFDKLVTDFYVNAQVISMVQNKGMVNEALRSLYKSKPDALYEPWSLLCFCNNLSSENNIYDALANGIMFDYK